VDPVVAGCVLAAGGVVFVAGLVVTVPLAAGVDVLPVEVAGEVFDAGVVDLVDLVPPPLVVAPPVFIPFPVEGGELVVPGDAAP
jgi:hypothetical protein